MPKCGIKTPLIGTCFIVWLRVGLVSSVIDPWCPCDISHNRRSVDCSGRNMTTIPKCALADKKMKHLDLSENTIAYFPSGVFANLFSLRSLDVSRNLLTRIENETFKDLSKLKKLDISFNQLDKRDSFDVEVFDPLKLLQSLYIQGNLNPRVSSDYTYPDAALSKATSVQNLYIDGLPSKVFGPGFSGMKHIKLLYFSKYHGYCDLTNILPGTFHSFRETPLQQIEFRGCHMRFIPPYTFAGLTNLTSVRSIWAYGLCDQAVENITAGLDTTNIKSLRFKNMCHNVTFKLGPDTFTGLTNTSLEKLALTENRITYIYPEAIRKLPTTLQHLSFRDNHIDDIQFLFRLVYLKNLELLDVSNQNVIDAGKRAVSSQYKPRHTAGDLWEERHYITSTTISESKDAMPIENHSLNYNVTPDFIKDERNIYGFPFSRVVTIELPPKLRFLYLSFFKLAGPVPRLRFTFNVLEYLDISSCNLKAFNGRLTGLHQLTFLNLSSNKLTHIDPKTFIDMHNLKTLLLQNNEIGKQMMLHETGKLFSNLINLEYLDLGNNDITNLPSTIFRNQIKLVSLDLTGNSLTLVPFEINTLVRLQMLNLRDNQLNCMPTDMCKELDKLVTFTNLSVDLRGNVLACDCDHSDFVEWLSITKVSFVNIANLTCRYTNKTEVSLLDIVAIRDQLQIECITWIILIASATSLVSILVIVSLAAVCYHKRWQLRYLYLTNRRILNPFHPSVGGEIEMTTDVYILFDPEYTLNADVYLDKFVKEHILPFLRSRAMSITIREDLRAGRPMDAVITETLQCTRKVIALLTSTYCNADDVWRYWEFNMAVYEGIYTQRDILVPVVIGDITPEDFSRHREVTSYINSMGEDVLRFSGKVEDFERFLEALYAKLTD